MRRAAELAMVKKFHAARVPLAVSSALRAKDTASVVLAGILLLSDEGR